MSVREIVELIDAFHDRVRALGIPIIAVRSILRRRGTDDIKGISAAWRRTFPCRAPSPRRSLRPPRANGISPETFLGHSGLNNRETAKMRARKTWAAALLLLASAVAGAQATVVAPGTPDMQAAPSIHFVSFCNVCVRYVRNPAGTRRTCVSWMNRCTAPRVRTHVPTHY
jgi:hypothetical protein